MPVYVEKTKDKNGKTIDKKANGQKQYFIRTYVEDEFGNHKQITRHNKKWLGRDGYIKAMQEEVRLKNEKTIKENKEKNLTLRDLKNKYLEYIKPRVDIDTFDGKIAKLNHFCEIDKTNQVKTLPDYKITKINKDIYIEWQQQMRKKKYSKGKTFFNYSIDRLNRIHNEIVLMFNYAVNEGLILLNPASQAGKFGTPKEISLSKKSNSYNVINYDEYLMLMKVTKGNNKYNTLFDLMFSCGPRAGEVRAFRVKDYSYEQKQLMVNFTMSKHNILKEPKTASSKAPIDLDDELNEKINNLINAIKNKEGFNDGWFIFNGENPLSSHSIDYNKDKYFKLAGINKHLRLHDFRHSCATWLFSIGTPITVISRILRHQDISVTMKTYTHLLEKDYKYELKRINSIKKNDKQD